MNLLATADAGSNSVAVMVVGMVITAVGGAVANYVNYLSTCKKLQFDAKLNDLQKDVQLLRDSHAECESAHEITLKKVEALSVRCERAETLAAKMEGELKGAIAERESMRQDIDKLRNLLYKQATSL